MCCVSDLQTPDFSNVVMESLDRVGQVEGAQLVTSGEGMPLQQHAPFPVMMHHGTSLSSSSASSSGGPLPGPSLSDPQASASTSGGQCLYYFATVQTVHQTAITCFCS